MGGGLFQIFGESVFLKNLEFEPAPSTPECDPEYDAEYDAEYD